MSSKYMRNFGVDKPSFSTDQDKKVACPGCYFTDRSKKIGILHVKGVDRDVHECSNCNRIYSKVDGGIKQFLEHVQEDLDLVPEEIGYTAATTDDPHISDGTVQPLANFGTPLNVNTYQLEYKTGEVKDEVSNVKTAVQNLTSTMDSYMWQISEALRKNTELMDKLMKDPLIGMRNAINNFNLK